MVFNATFNNILAISGRSVLLLGETRVPVETTDLSKVTDKLYHIKLYWLHLTWAGFELMEFWVILLTNISVSNESNITVFPLLSGQISDALIGPPQEMPLSYKPTCALQKKDRHDRDRTIVVLQTSSAISAYYS